MLFPTHWALSLPAIVVAAGFVLRLFVLQHDCGHGSFLAKGSQNRALGRVASLVTGMPYESWRRDHSEHHASSGNLDRRGVGDIDTATRGEYEALGRGPRRAYRAMRNPALLLLAGPVYLWMRMRLPSAAQRTSGAHLRSILFTDAALLAAIVGLCVWLGTGRVLFVHGLVTWLAGMAGIWFFFVQHQFERTSWSADGDWSFHEAALWGSSFYDLPAPLRWLSCDIGIHHVHHLSSRIPNYRLREALAATPELRAINRFTLKDSARMFRLALWDEQRGRLVSFRRVRRPFPLARPAAAAAAESKPTVVAGAE